MPKRYDATAKSLLEADPGAWLALAGRAADGPLAAANTDVSTITAAVDGVFRVDGPSPWLAHFEFQASADPTLAARLWRYNYLLDQHQGLPALSIAILLRPKADGSNLTGVYQRRLPDGGLCHEFHCAVVRIWEVPARQLLEGGLSTLPLAAIADLGGEPLPEILQRIDQRLDREAPSEEAGKLWAATSVLLGLHHPPEFTRALFQGGRFMDLINESTTFQWFRDEGRIVEAVRIILKLGRLRFGAPTAETVTALEGMRDIPSLEDLTEKVILVGSWEELLAPPFGGNGISS